MKFKSTWLVIAAFAALACYLVFVDDPRQEQQRVAAEQSGLLFPEFDANQVNTLQLNNAHGEITITREEGGLWQVAKPWHDRGNDGRINNLFSDLSKLKSEREVAAADADLSAFGLDQPEVVVRTVGQDAVLSVGAENPAGNARYVRVGEGPVVTVSSQLTNPFMVQLQDLRSQDVVERFPWDDLSALEIQSAEAAPIRVEKQPDGWQLSSPVQGEADPDAVQRLTDKLRWAKVNSFLDDEAANADEKWTGGVTVILEATGDVPTVKVRMARVEDAVWATRRGRDANFTVPGDVLEVFEIDAEQLQRNKPLLVKAWKINKLEIASAGGDTRSYEKVNGTWQRDTAALEGTEQSALQNLLDALENTPADQVISKTESPVKYSLAPAQFTVTVQDNEGSVQKMQLSTQEEAAFARSPEGGPIYRMPASYAAVVEALFAEPAAPAAPPKESEQ